VHTLERNPKFMAKLKVPPLRRVMLGVLLAFLVFQVTEAQHPCAELVQIENCSACLHGSDDPVVATANLSLPKIAFLHDDYAVASTRGMVSFVVFDRLSRAPPLS